MNNIIQTIRHAARAATVLLLALLTAQTAGAQTNVTDADGLEKAFDNTTVSEINVTADITGVGGLTPLNRDLTINLNGHTISGDYLNFNVDPDCSLTINGGGQDGSVGNIIRGNAYNYAINNNGTVTLSNVNIITYPDNAINGGTLNIGDNVSFKYISDIDNAAGLVDAFDNTNVGVINVTADITGVGDLFLNHDLTIYLNGYTISGDGLYFNAFEGCSLTINGVDGSVGNITSGYADGPAIYNDGTVTLSHVNITTNSEYAIGGNTLNIGDNVSFNGWTSVPFDTEDVNITGNYNYDPENYNPLANVVATVTVGGVTHYFENSGAALAYINSHPDNDHFSLSGTTYTIHTATGWDAFCYLLANSDKGYFSGKTVQLDADITVTRMAGGDSHEFTGTFDGDGHTLTFNYTTTENYAAPFRNVESGCVIKNLHVSGTINTSAMFAAGLVGDQYGAVTIRNCRSSVTINSTISGDGTHAGFVARNGNGSGSVLTIEGCVFDGRLLGPSTNSCGGFIGWRYKAATITNSLFAPAEVTVQNEGSATFARSGVDTYNCYYTTLLNDGNDYAPAYVGGTETPNLWRNGKATRTVAAAADVTIGAVALTGIAIQYTVSGITAYSGGGLQRGQTLYYGSGDQLSLTLSNTATAAPQGYQYGYTASAGTLSGTTLTMPDEDVTISAALAPIDWATVNQGNSEDDPYMIYNKDQLDLLAHRVNGTHGETADEDGYSGKYFRLGADITYTYTKAWNEATTEDDNNYEAIGYYDGGTNYRYFSGNFDGAGHTISGIRIYRSGNDDADKYQGIFGLTDGANIHGLRLADARITGYDNTGGIVGNNYQGTVTDCHVASNVCIHAAQSNAWYHGGIAGDNAGTVENSTSAATLTIPTGATGCECYGAIAGNNSSTGTLRDNLAIGATVPATGNSYYGAIAGRNNNGGTLQRNYYAACTVAGTENATGVGCGYIDDGNGGYTTADVNNEDNPDGAVCINTLALTANLAPDGNFWTTYYNGALGFTIDEDENACAYTATYGGSQLTLHKLGKEIPAGTAVIIVAETRVVSMTAATTLDDFSGDNDLRGVNVDTPVTDIRNDLGEGTLYVLGMTTVGNEQHFGFHRYTGSMMAAHKAFVLVSGSQSARSLTMVFDEASGIESLTPDAAPKAQAAEHWFTLDGRRLQAKPTAPGIYVNNGRKVVIK